MNSRWFNVAVFALWLTTMSWLVVVKILPTLAVGDPPDRVAILNAQAEEQLACYKVLWESEPIGWAQVAGERLASGGAQIVGQIRFDQLPIRRMVPKGLLEFFGLDGSIPDYIHLEAKNEVCFHGNGRLQRFTSTVSLDRGYAMVRVDGFAVGETILLTVRSAGATYETRRGLPQKAILNDALMPQSQMPGLWEGRKWRVEVYSPLRLRTDPMEIMLAEVVRREPLLWDGQLENAWLVVYRNDPGGEAGQAGKERAWFWVRDDGVVLQQRIAVLDGTLTFVRLPDSSGQELEPLFRKSWLADDAEPEGSPSEGEAADRETEGEAEEP